VRGWSNEGGDLKVHGGVGGESGKVSIEGWSLEGVKRVYLFSRGFDYSDDRVQDLERNLS
jgi:hypothetical protein